MNIKLKNKIIIVLLVMILLIFSFSVVSAKHPGLYEQNPNVASCTDAYIDQNVYIEMSQHKACPGDSVVLRISNVSFCNGFNLSVRDNALDGIILCNNTEITGGEALCIFNAPSSVVPAIDRPVSVAILGYGDAVTGNNTTKINITSKPSSLAGCFDAFGATTACDQTCTDKPVLRLWQDVYSVSLPLHFTFGISNSNNRDYNQESNIANNTKLYGLLSGTLLDCGAISSTNLETHNITRYQYAWGLNYEAIVTAYSKTDYVPMFVGLDQEPILSSDSAVTQSIAGVCSGDNSLCYTEVPLCGDNVCDVKGGENCRTCASDCRIGGHVDGFDGDCNIGCTGCRPNDGTVDDRGCFIRKKVEKEDCTCADQCGSNLQCTWDQINGTRLAPKGKCCPSGEMWNENPIAWLGGRCEKKRALRIVDITFEVSDGGNNWYVPIFWDKIYCCPFRSDFKWLRVNYTIKNEGTVPETFTIERGFSQELPPQIGITGQYVAANTPKYFSDSIPNVLPNTYVSVSSYWSCVRSNIGSCNRVNADPRYTGSAYSLTGIDQLNRDPLPFNDPMLFTIIKITTPGYLDQNPVLRHWQKLPDETVVRCDASMLSCNKTIYTPRGLTITPSGVTSFTGICGGVEHSDWAVNPIFPWAPIDCDPFNI